MSRKKFAGTPTKEQLDNAKALLDFMCAWRPNPNRKANPTRKAKRKAQRIARRNNR